MFLILRVFVRGGEGISELSAWVSVGVIAVSIYSPSPSLSTHGFSWTLDLQDSSSVIPIGSTSDAFNCHI